MSSRLKSSIIISYVKQEKTQILTLTQNKESNYKKLLADKKAQKDYMSKLSKAWEEHKGVKEAQESIVESKATDLAKDMIGDGGDPNYHFVTMSDDYCYEKGEERG